MEVSDFFYQTSQFKVIDHFIQIINESVEIKATFGSWKILGKMRAKRKQRKIVEGKKN